MGLVFLLNANYGARNNQFVFIVNWVHQSLVINMLLNHLFGQYCHTLPLEYHIKDDIRAGRVKPYFIAYII